MRKMKNITLIIILHIIFETIGNKTANPLIYILIWSQANLTPALDDEQGQLYFINKNCRFQNCFLTSNVSYFEDVRDFDVILFNSMTLDSGLNLPSTRSEKQKYVFMSDESPAMYPAPKRYNGFFNFTWTYKLDSDTTWKFYIIRNKEGKIIGPGKNIKWLDWKDMKPVSDELKSKFKNKNKTAAWFVSHCGTPSKREEFVKNLNEELEKYNLHVDIYGTCGNLECSRTEREKCCALIESDYYFYLSFENSICEDYLTEKLLIATKHYAVPIVYSGVDYTR